MYLQLVIMMVMEVSESKYLAVLVIGASLLAYSLIQVLSKLMEVVRADPRIQAVIYFMVALISIAVVNTGIVKLKQAQ